MILCCEVRPSVSVGVAIHVSVVTSVSDKMSSMSTEMIDISDIYVEARYSL